MSGTLRPLQAPVPVTQPNQPIGGQMPGSAMAAAMMRPATPFSLPAPSMGIPLSSLASLMKPQYGNPNGQQSMGAGADPAVLAAQMAGNQPIGQLGAPIGPSGYQSQQPGMWDSIGSWLSNLRGMGGVGGGGS